MKRALAASLSYPSPLWGGWPAPRAGRVGVSNEGILRGTPTPASASGRCSASSRLGRPSPQGGGISLRHHSNHQRCEKLASISSYAIALPASGRGSAPHPWRAVVVNKESPEAFQTVRKPS